VDQLDGRARDRDAANLGAGDFACRKRQQRPHAFAAAERA